MQKKHLFAFLPVLVPLAVGAWLHFGQDDTEWRWPMPSWVPLPVVPADNPMTPAKVELGRHLFYDKRLSITGDMACASCHEQAKAFTDGKVHAVGATGEPHRRNSMGLANSAYAVSYTWANPLLQSLELQALVPMFSEDPVEMGLMNREQAIFANLSQDPTYRQLLRAVGAKELDLSTVTKALASFERALVSFNSPYDRYRYGGQEDAISEAAKRGEEMFFSERLECFHCHGSVTFSNATRHQKSPFWEMGLHNTGLYNIDGKGAYPARDTGALEISGDPKDMGKFRTPSLRNVAVTAPYFHDGSAATLSEALAHYEAGGRTIAEGPDAGNGSISPRKDILVLGFKLSAEEKADLVAFLESLTDREFLTNPAFSDPWAKNK
ncbi:MbnH family di-heme enzyme [Lacibacterium aquatile]|uniref:MbnH family di-heme enzyme n=1 Tax=Lacibacterium aquatile TaxID=1168082 RepID=A0ABW5DX42_9PROT